MAHDQNAKNFRNIADRHAEETGEMLFSGADANGYYFSFGFFPNDRVGEAAAELQRRRDAVPHVMATGMDNGQPFTYRQCPENYCIGSPHPKGTRHHDNTGATWRTRSTGEPYGVQGHDGE